MSEPVTPIVVGLHLDRDDAPGLRRCLPTIFSQTWQGPLTAAIVVTGDVDRETRNVLDGLIARFERIEVIDAPAPTARARARDLALARASDDAWFAWMELGAAWGPRKLERHRDAADGAPSPPHLTLTTGPHARPSDGRRDPELDRTDVAGDPLRGLLAGTSTIDLATVAGPAAAFRRVGGFDAGLRYRDDVEFLVRFLRHGGQLVATPSSRPLGTSPEASGHTAAREVAAAVRYLHREHGAAYREYGDRFARETFRRDLERVARWYANEGDDVRARFYRTRARALAVRGRLSRKRDRVGRAAERPLGGPLEPPAAIVEHAAPAATAAIEVTGPGPTPAPPDGPAARAAQRARQEDWTAAIAAWSETDDRDRHAADPTTYELIARAHRAVGDHHAAVAIGTTATSRWPAHRGVRVELAKSRAAITDWRASLTVMASAPQGGADPAGEVADLGALAGGDGPITGWVRTGTVAPRVSLLLGDTVVAATHAARDRRSSSHDGATFALRCDQIVEFLGDGDVLTVVCDAHPLVFDLPAHTGGGRGTELRVRTGFPSRADELRDRVTRGHVFTKFGRLRPGYTPARKRRTLELFGEVSAVVAARCGATCFPFYGNLLGAIRDQDFIAHDVGGFDAGFVSSARTPDAVRAEVVEVCRALLDHGYHLELEPFSTMIRTAPGDRVFVDLNYAWFTDTDELHLSYGWRDAPVVGRARVLDPRDAFLAGRLVSVPADAEAVLHQIYGLTWPIPDQGFDPAHRLRRDDAFLLTPEDAQEVRRRAPGHVRILKDLDPPRS